MIGSEAMLLELLKPASFLFSILSLYPVMMNAFFVPGTRWEERLELALLASDSQPVFASPAA
jgi:hypothetical protein